MQSFKETLREIGLVPVVKIDDAKNAEPLARALLAGGIPAAEVTFRTDAAEEAIRNMRAACPEMLVGAGTVINEAQCRRAIDAGAQFVVSPGYVQQVVDCCLKAGLPVLPGCATAADMIAAVNSGLDLVKFFPAEQAGGLGYLKAVAPVFPKLDFMPTGGVNAGNLNTYLAFPRIVACGGSWTVKSDLIAAGRFDEITALCRQAVETMLGFKIVHVGLNCADAAEAASVAGTFGHLFGFDAQEGNKSWFASPEIEIMKAPGRGVHGHLAVAVNSMTRAVAYFKRMGVEVDLETAKYRDNGQMRFVYLKEPVGGFGVHLIEQ